MTNGQFQLVLQSTFKMANRPTAKEDPFKNMIGNGIDLNHNNEIL